MKQLFVSANVLLMLAVWAGAARSADYTLEAAGEPPETLASDIKQSVQAEGYRIQGQEGAIGEIWLVKSPVQQEGFRSTLRVKYPFEVGTLVGVLRVGEKGEFTDFRDQLILPGVYTLRYGQQPQDGNHIGTSQQADFLLAVPAQEEKSAKQIADTDELNAVSAEAAGSSHPAIFSLLPPGDDKVDMAKLTHDDGRDFWILHTPGSEKRPALQLVVVGIGEE